jgi:8-oxo-dGTP diphosphatase
MPAIETLVIIFSLHQEQLQVLLCQNQDEFARLPGRILAEDMTLEDNALACLTEQTGLTQAYLEQLYTYGDLQRYTGTDRLVSVAYFALLASDAIHQIPTHQNWQPVNNLPKLLHNHTDIVHYALRRLRYKLEYSAVGFELLPEAFSLSELQRTYEIILGETLDKRNFRRRILQANVIEPTPHQRGGEGRPARLYRYRPDAIAEIKTRRLFP